MRVVLEIVNTGNGKSAGSVPETFAFGREGGLIGCSKTAKWRLENINGSVLDLHAEIVYKNGRFHITGAGKGTVEMKKPEKRVAKGVMVPLTKESRFCIGEYTIAVKSIDSAPPEKGGPSAQTAAPSEAADSFFKGNPHHKAVQIIDSPSPSQNDVLALIDNRVETPPKTDELLLPELDSILESYKKAEEQSPDNSLGTHIDPSALSVDSPDGEKGSKKSGKKAVEAEEDEEDESILKIISVKLGVDTEKMSRKEKEKFAAEVAQLAFTSLENARNTSSVLQKVQSQLGVTTFSTNNPLKTASETKEIFSNLLHYKPSVSEQIKNLFFDIEKHTIAFHTAYKKVSLRNAKKFSPKKLYARFKNEGELKKSLFNKKAQAWDAYCKEFEYLDHMKEEKIDNSELKKEYNKVLETLSLSYNPAKNRGGK